MASARAVSPSVSRRLPGLDWLRVGATFLVVLLHAGVPYTVAPMPGLTWPVRHTVTSSVVDCVFWGIEGAIMPLFFLLSGYGAAHTLHSHPDRFLANRWRRLGWPFVGAAAVVLPIELYLWMLGWVADGLISPVKFRSLSLGPWHRNLWGFSHLWYLEYLLIYSVLLWAGVRWLEKKPVDDRRHLSNVLNAHRTTWMFLASVAVLWWTPEVIVGFQHHFLPVPPKFLFSGLFFLAGVAEFHRPSHPSWTISTKASFAAWIFVSALPLIHLQVDSPLQGPLRFVLASCLATYTWLVLAAAWQWGMSATQPASVRLTYLAKASFWTYLVHHPLVAVWQIGLRTTEWPALIQFAICSLGTVALSLASYEVLVRRTWLGHFLEGLPQRPLSPVPASSERPTIAEPETVPLRRAA